MSFFLISQIIAAGALLSGILTFQLKKREHILIAFAVMSSLLSLHFYILEEYTASAVVAVSVIRFITSIFFRHYALMFVFLIVTATVGFCTYAAWYNLIAILAGLLGVMATFQADDKRLRRIMLGSSGTMALHDAIVGTPVGLMVDLTVFSSNIVGYYRYYVQKVTSEAA